MFNLDHLSDYRNIHVYCIDTGVFVARGKEDALVTLNSVPGDSVYGEKRISIEVGLFSGQIDSLAKDQILD